MLSGFRRHLKISSLALSVAMALPSAHAQECDWLTDHVKGSMLPPPPDIRFKGAPEPIRDAFPVAPKQITISTYWSPDARPERHDKYRTFVTSAVSDLGLPIDAVSNDQNPHIVVFFFKQGLTTEDTPGLVAQFQDIPHRPKWFPDNPNIYFAMIFSTCSATFAITADAKLKDGTIVVPFDGATGEPIPEAHSCVRQGLLKAFGVGLNRDGPTGNGWKSSCPECDDVDKRIARILHDNNQSAKTLIRAEEMVRRLAGPRC